MCNATSAVHAYVLMTNHVHLKDKQNKRYFSCRPSAAQPHKTPLGHPIVACQRATRRSRRWLPPRHTTAACRSCLQLGVARLCGLDMPITMG